MELNIIEKGQTFDLSVVSKREAPAKFYFGAGWDTKDGAAVDLDIVAVVRRGGVLAKQEDYVYFGHRVGAGVPNGVALSKDNTTGEGDGDDESIIIDVLAVDADVDSIVVGLVAYDGADLSCAPNTHFRVCDGDNEQSEEIGHVTIGDTAIPNDTGAVMFTLVRSGDTFVLENSVELMQIGFKGAAIKAFGARFQAVSA